MVAATRIITPVEAESRYRPITAIPEQGAKRPRDEILWIKGPAKKRNTNMMAEVYTKIHPACRPMSFIAGAIRSVIQLSVPNSVVAKGIITNKRMINNGLPKLLV